MEEVWRSCSYDRSVRMPFDNLDAACHSFDLDKNKQSEQLSALGLFDFLPHPSPRAVEQGFARANEPRARR